MDTFLYHSFFSLIIIATLTLSSTYLYGYKKGYKELNEDRIEDISIYERKLKL